MKVGALLLGPLLIVGLTVTAAEDEIAEPPWLGVYLGESDRGGVAILAVVDGGPAQRGGLRAGDVLTSLGDVEIRGPDDVSAFLDGAAPGTEVRAGFLRDGRAGSRTIVLRARPEIWDLPRYRAAPSAQADSLRRAAAATAGGWLGITLAEIPGELRIHYGASPGRGALVTRVAPGGAGSLAGVAVGDVLTRAGETVVRGPRDLAAAVVVARSERELELEVVRDGKRRVLGLLVRRVPTPAPDARAEETEQGDGAEVAIRIRLLEGELKRLEGRIREIREELDRLKGGR